MEFPVFLRDARLKKLDFPVFLCLFLVWSGVFHLLLCFGHLKMLGFPVLVVLCTSKSAWIGCF